MSPEFVHQGHPWKVGMLTVVLMHQMNLSMNSLSLTHSFQVVITFPVLDPHVFGPFDLEGKGLHVDTVLAAHSDTANNSSLNIFCKSNWDKL